jgi:uncharacterized protein (DUF1330 family)
MTAYCLWDVREIHDQNAMDDYVARVTETVTAFGGKYVVIGGPWQIVEGDWHPAYPVLIEFPSLERAHEWYSSELYAPLRELRHAASVSDAVFFDGATAATVHHLSRSMDAPLADVAFDLYRDVHKGIRHGLFHATEQAGLVDPLDDIALSEQRTRIESLLHLLDVHAAHEDEYLGPVIEQHLPVLAAQLRREHAHLDERTVEIRRQLTALDCSSRRDRRIGQHRLYLTLSEFTSAYLQHQTTEEVEVLPALNRAAALDELIEANAVLVGAISPDDLDGYMRLIVPAANPLDLTELYGAMRAGTPDDAFASLLDLARDGLDQHAYDRLANDLVRA